MNLKVLRLLERLHVKFRFQKVICQHKCCCVTKGCKVCQKGQQKGHALTASCSRQDGGCQVGPYPRLVTLWETQEEMANEPPQKWGQPVVSAKPGWGCSRLAYQVSPKILPLQKKRLVLTSNFQHSHQDILALLLLGSGGWSLHLIWPCHRVRQV